MKKQICALIAAVTLLTPITAQAAAPRGTNGTNGVNYNNGGVNNYNNNGANGVNRTNGGVTENKFSVSEGTYILQDGDDLWLIMGNIKAKLSMLIYAAEDGSQKSYGSQSQNGGSYDKNNLALPVISR